MLFVEPLFHDMGLISKKITSGERYLSGGKKTTRKFPTKRFDERIKSD